jgi:prolyl-tRNA synthetase
MRFSHHFGRTLREVPAEAETPSHRLLLRAGLVQQLAAGIYSYLPLGWKVLRKIEQIIREEMDAAGGQELMLPALHPIEIWEASGRLPLFGDTVFTLSDRRKRGLVLGPTHEEIMADLFKRHVQSYRDLPLLLYQIQVKFRDEARPRGGLIRVREFTMKDLYSFDADDDGLDESCQKMLRAYKNIFDRCGVPTIVVEADSGAIGGKDSWEFMFPCDSGEDQAVVCSACDYAANAEKARFRKPAVPQEPPKPLEEVSTPGIKAIDDLCEFLGIAPWQTLKAVFYAADGQPAFVAIRGDMEVNETKLRNALGVVDLHLMDSIELEAAGLVAGYASPAGLKGVKIVADDAVPSSPNLVGGANKPDAHQRNLNYGRDWTADIVIDIALAGEGDACPRCGAPLTLTRVMEMGHVFKLGTIYSEKLGATFLDREGVARPVVMGSYGIGTGRLLAGVVEAGHDEQGIIWPPQLAPYDSHLLALGMDRLAVVEACERLYEQLQQAGISVLYDDRDESAGVKFNDADLLGMPLRLTVSPRTLEKESVEVKRRSEKESMLVPLREAAERLRELVKLA